MYLETRDLDYRTYALAQEKENWVERCANTCKSAGQEAMRYKNIDLRNIPAYAFLFIRNVPPIRKFNLVSHNP